MSNSHYANGIVLIGTKQINLATDSLKVQMLAGTSSLSPLVTYTPTLATDQFYSDIPSGALIGSPVALTGQSFAAVLNGSAYAGVFDATDVMVKVQVSEPDALLL